MGMILCTGFPLTAPPCHKRIYQPSVIDENTPPYHVERYDIPCAADEETTSPLEGCTGLSSIIEVMLQYTLA